MGVFIGIETLFKRRNSWITKGAELRARHAEQEKPNGSQKNGSAREPPTPEPSKPKLKKAIARPAIN